MKVIILAGGTGTRMKEETEFKPKPMVEIGGRPLLTYIMQSYMKFNYRHFIMALGYKGEMIRRYFFEYPLMANDVTISAAGVFESRACPIEADTFKVSLCDTGLESQTGERILRARKFLGNDPTFLCTYGDGLCNVNIQDVVDYHRAHGRAATLVAVQPQSKYGILKLGAGGVSNLDVEVKSFEEKPKSSEWINAGFFVFNQDIFEHMSLLEPSERTLETVLSQMAEEGQLMAYKHDGYFHSVDTSKDLQELNSLYEKGELPWTK